MSSGPHEVDEFAWLEGWYRGRCNGDWEHENGVTIESIDNPGWKVAIDIDDVPGGSGNRVLDVVGDPPEAANRNVGGPVWMRCEVKDRRFLGAGDPGQLRAIIRCFREKVVGDGAVGRK